MNWSLDKSRPICPQLGELICVGIANGTLAAGERMPSVREIALAAGVNPNTVQKSLEDLERRGVIHSVRCSGWYINEDVTAAVAEVESLRIKKTEAYLLVMKQLGCVPEEIIHYLTKDQGGNV